MITRGELKGLILRQLNKTAGFQGFYSDEKINDAIEDCLDFLAVEMFLAGEGWQTKLSFIDTVANQIQIPLPAHIGIINEVRILSGNGYLPLTYDDKSGRAQSTLTTSTTGTDGTYRIIDNCLYFDPPLREAQTGGIQIDHTTFPKRLIDDHDFIEAHFYKPFQHFVKFRAASILNSGVGKAQSDWAAYESQWYAKVQAVIVKRNAQTTYIREFGE
jgi:hypothetical protein